MTQPTRQEIIEAQLARQWAEQVQQSDAEYERKGRRYSGDPMRAAAAYILSHTPAPTMAEVEWDDELHYLAEAKHPSWGKVIMLYKDPYAQAIHTFTKTDDAYYLPSVPPKSLTPTGKRYTLTEVHND